MWGRDQKSGYDIAQHKRLAELLEQQGDGSGHDQDQGQVAHEMGKGIDRRLAFFFLGWYVVSEGRPKEGAGWREKK